MKKIPLITLLFLFLSGVVFAQEKKDLTLDLIFKERTLSPKGVYGLRSMKDGEFYTQLKKDSINAYSYKTGELFRVIVIADELIPESDTIPIRMRSYRFNKDETKILFATETERIYRYSSKSNYYIFDLGTKKLSPLSENGKQRLADFSPVGDKVAFVRENNIFIKNLETGEEKQITFDGKDRHIINGTTDWVYEEEFAVTNGFKWSADGKKLAYMRFDESEVQEYFLTYYGELYPKGNKYKYPKAGEDNSIVSIHVYSLESGETQTMDTGSETDQYIPRIMWTTETNILAILRLNRLQNKLEILLADASNGQSRVIYSEENKYYIDESIYDNIVFLDDGQSFVIPSERDSFYHLYLYDMTGKIIKQLTTGNWDVTGLLGVDRKKKKVYYAAAEVSPLDRNVYVVGLNGKNNKCLTPKAGTDKAEFSTTFKYFINTWSNANTPPVITVNRGSDGKQIRILEDNQKLIERREEYNLSKKEFFTFTTSEGVELNGWKILPPNFDTSVKYPVLMDIYGGPGSQTVRNNYGRGDLWNQYLAEQGIIIVSVDNRGTACRGEEFKKMTYKELGKFETIDLIEAAKYLGTLPYIDKGHIGIFGWSYGGYMSALCMTKGADYFSVGIAVAPVTNWRYYDNIYTERFMRTPQENPDGYDDNSPINHVDKLKGKFLVVHGMADDNVHPQNTYDLILALVAADKDFEVMVYPNSNHGIYTGPNTTFHLFKKITKFLLENLK